MKASMAAPTPQDDYEELIKPRKYIVAHNSRRNFAWNILIIISATYLSILLPMKISWSVLADYVDSILLLVVVENLVDVLFFIDILQSFFVSYVDTFSGDVITQPKLIAKRYMTSSFPIDFLSTVPF